METKTLVARTWDDLIFIGRNKEYGAYPLRKSYSKNVIVGWGVTVAVAALLLLSVQFKDGKVQVVIPPITDRGGLVEVLPPPIFKPKPEPKPQTQIKEVNNTILPPRVVTELVETPVDITPLVDVSTSSTDGTGSSETVDVGVSTGVSDIPVVVEDKGPRLFAEVMPAYEGGYNAMMTFIRRNLKYPRSAQSMGTQGTVYVAFVVNGDGTVTDVSIVRGISKACDEETMRVIKKMSGWIGGKQNGNPVAVRMTLPITFSLE